MQDKTIDSALLELRKQIIRGNGQSQDAVETLLAMRGVDMPPVNRGHRPDVAKRYQMRLWITKALKDGPQTLQELTDHIADRTPDVPRRLVYGRVSQALHKMYGKGLVRHKGQLWLDT